LWIGHIYIPKVYTFAEEKYFMKNLSLKLDDSIFEQTEEMMNLFNISRNRYINNALEYYNRINRRKLLAEQFKKESQIVSEDSLSILKEFEMIGYED
jgi:hypothetical protein